MVSGYSVYLAYAKCRMFDTVANVDEIAISQFHGARDVFWHFNFYFKMWHFFAHMTSLSDLCLFIEGKPCYALACSQPAVWSVCQGFTIGANHGLVDVLNLFHSPLKHQVVFL